MNVKPRTMKPLYLILLAVLMLQPAVPAAQTRCVDDQRERKTASQKCVDFYTGCRKIGLRVYLDMGEDSGLGLTDKAIQATVESRLRSARIYDPGVKFPSLYAAAGGSRRLFVVRLAFDKYVFDPLSGEKGIVQTWQDGRFEQSTDRILLLLSELTDQFLVEFLRVNEKACARRDKKAPRTETRR